MRILCHDFIFLFLLIFFVASFIQAGTCPDFRTTLEPIGPDQPGITRL